MIQIKRTHAQKSEIKPENQRIDYCHMKFFSNPEAVKVGILKVLEFIFIPLNP